MLCINKVPQIIIFSLTLNKYIHFTLTFNNTQSDSDYVNYKSSYISGVSFVKLEDRPQIISQLRLNRKIKI